MDGRIYTGGNNACMQVNVDGETLSPILLNTFANGYYIEKTGEFDVTLEFKLQGYYAISGYISLFSLLGVLAYVTHEEIRRTIFVTKRTVEKLGKHLRKPMELMRARLLLKRKGEMR